MNIKREDFLNKLLIVQPGLSTREIVEQSSCFVFKDGMIMTYNDEIACRTKLNLGLEGAVPADKLLSLLGKMIEEEIEIENEDGQLKIKGKGSRKSGIRMEAEVLLSVDKVEMPKKGDWKELHEDFTEAVSICCESANRDSSSGWSTCLHITPKWIEAMDNMQMTRFQIETGVEEKVLIRANSIKHLATLDVEEFAVTSKWMHFRSKNKMLFSCRRFIDEFRDPSKFFKVSGIKTSLPKGLASSAEIAEIFSSEEKDRNELLVTLTNGKVRIRGEGASGWFSESKKLKYRGEDLCFTIPPKLLREITTRHNECEISEKCLLVDGGKFKYVTSLGKPEKPKKKKKGKKKDEDDSSED